MCTKDRFLSAHQRLTPEVVSWACIFDGCHLAWHFWISTVRGITFSRFASLLVPMWCLHVHLIVATGHLAVNKQVVGECRESPPISKQLKTILILNS